MYGYVEWLSDFKLMVYKGTNDRYNVQVLRKNKTCTGGMWGMK